VFAVTAYSAARGGVACAGLVSTGVSDFHTAIAAAAVVVSSVTIVAALAAGLDRVSTGCCASISGIDASSVTLVSTLHCACGRAPVARSGVSVVTGFLANVIAVTAYFAARGGAAGVGLLSTSVSDFNTAIAAAAVVISGVTIIAALAAGLDRVSTGGCAIISGIDASSVTLVSALHCACGRAPVARSGVSVVTEILDVGF